MKMNNIKDDIIFVVMCSIGMIGCALMLNDSTVGSLVFNFGFVGSFIGIVLGLHEIFVDLDTQTKNKETNKDEQ